jgi:hypothetical protein
MSNGPAAVFTQPVYLMPVATPLVVSTAVVSVSASSIPNGASGALISNALGAGPVNWLYGTNPSTIVGIPLAAGEVMGLEDSADLTQLRFIRQSTTDGALTFQFGSVKNIR